MQLAEIGMQMKMFWFLTSCHPAKLRFCSVCSLAPIQNALRPISGDGSPNCVAPRGIPCSFEGSGLPVSTISFPQYSGSLYYAILWTAICLTRSPRLLKLDECHFAHLRTSDLISFGLRDHLVPLLLRSDYDDYRRSRGSYEEKRSRQHEPSGYDSRATRDGYNRMDYGDRRSRPADPPSLKYSGEGRPRGGPSGVTPKPSRVLGVFGLSLRTEERHLYDIMSAYGPVEDIQIVYDSLTG